MQATLDKRLAKAKKILEGVMTDLGVSPSENEVTTDEHGIAWQISRGSADVLISLVSGRKNSAGRVRVVSPIVKLEKGMAKDVGEFLLALNATELPGICFGWASDNIIVLVSERSILGLDKLEAKEMINLVGYYADKYDDILVEKYGGTRVCDIE